MELCSVEPKLSPSPQIELWGGDGVSVLGVCAFAAELDVSKRFHTSAG